jgi:hypothetical protein
MGESGSTTVFRKSGQGDCRKCRARDGLIPAYDQTIKQVLNCEFASRFVLTGIELRIAGLIATDVIWLA